MGATPGGAIHERAVIVLPGLHRRAANRVLIRVDKPGSVVRVSFDQGTVHLLRTDRNGAAAVEMPPADVPGARIDLFRTEGEPPARIQAFSVESDTKPSLLALGFFGALAAFISLVLMGWKGLRIGLALGCITAALVALFATPALVFLNAPVSGSFVRLMIPVLWLGASLAFVYTARTDRRFFWKAALVLAAFLFGFWVRLYFLPSAGSWDNEYWKAWMMRTVSHGVTQVYGDADAVPEGRFMEQLLGRDKLWRVDYYGRDFAVDYPPLAMALWRASWWTVSTLMPWWNYAEAQNVAVKLPSVLGDILAVVILFVALRRRPERAWTLGALYWALPVTWLSSAVLGFVDGAYMSFAVCGLLAAGSGRAVYAGGLLALSALIKPLGIIVIPAAVALWIRRAELLKAIGAGLGVVGVTLVPFYLAGTLAEAVVHVSRNFFQERLSAGFANPWWVVGHLARAANEGVEVLTQPVSFTLTGTVDFPVHFVALGSFGLTTLLICRCLRRYPGAGPACLAGAAVFFSYSMFAMGVHYNHPHLIFLTLAVTGLTSRRLQVIAGTLTASYVINLLMMAGLGRFYGPRYSMLEPATHVISNLRMAFGLDLTLTLSLLNTTLYVWLIVSLPRELECAGLNEKDFSAEGSSADSSISENQRRGFLG
jgi:hypothetical protein